MADVEKSKRKTTIPPASAVQRRAPNPTAQLPLPVTPPLGLVAQEVRVSEEELALLSYPLESSDPCAQLTGAERDIVTALLLGRSNAEIAKERGSAERTVANQVASAYRKLAVRSRAELAAICVLVPFDET